jgi:lysophospholipase L1-like esterase
MGAALGVVLAATSCTQPPKAPVPPPVGSIGALGDSISRAFDACNFLQDCPAKSWTTGSDAGVSSHYRRLLARNPALTGHVFNLAKVGGTSADLPGQASALAAHRPDYVTMLIGANDACANSEAAMTSPSVFRARVDTALGTLYRTRPDTRVLVASIPNLYRLWQVGHTNPMAQLAWSTGFCRTMLDRPTSTATTDEARRRRVQAQVIAFNAELAAACRAHPGCRFDDNAVYNYPFAVGDLSGFDFFHPNAAGQQKLAAITWAKTGL